MKPQFRRLRSSKVGVEVLLVAPRAPPAPLRLCWHFKKVPKKRKVHFSETEEPQEDRAARTESAVK